MKKLLIKFPTRNRPGKFFDTLDCYYNMQKNSNQYLINIDSDDATMNNESVLSRLQSYTNLTVHIGNSKTKIEACNCGLENVEFDVLLLASDDMIPKIKGFDEIILQQYENRSDFVLWTYDGFQNRVCTLSIIDYEYYSRFNYIYNPEYKSFWCDNEFTEVAKKLSRLKILNQCIIKHDHPVWTDNKKDGLYSENEKYYTIDKQTYTKRQKNNFPYIRWSILIPSITERQNKLNSLLNNLNTQIRNSKLENCIEIIVNTDNRVKSIGQKRNELIQSAKGVYISFIDDDDNISNDYISTLFCIMQSNCDCLSLAGQMYVNGKVHKKFIHSLDYSQYSENNDCYFRPPNHLNPIKRTIANKFSFENINHGEDTDWAMRISNSKAIKTEYTIQTIYYYYFYDNRKKVLPK